MKTINKAPTIKELDKLWADCVKARDGHICVYSQDIHKKIELEGLNAHHILKKGNYRIRYELDNGITITKGIHFYVAHGPGCRPKQFEEWALARLPKARREKLLMFQHALGGTNKSALKIYLQKELEKFERNNESKSS